MIMVITIFELFDVYFLDIILLVDEKKKNG